MKGRSNFQAEGKSFVNSLYHKYFINIKTLIFQQFMLNNQLLLMPPKTYAILIILILWMRKQGQDG
jgi:hypothetical protein